MTLYKGSYQKPSQEGFTLVAVLILTIVAGIVVLNSLKDNVVQERMSGNFQKAINARLASEKGVFDTFDTMNAALEANPSMSVQQIIAASTNDGKKSSSRLILDDTSYLVELTGSGSELTLQSDGKRFEGKSGIKTVFGLVSTPGSGNSPFANGITGCEGLEVAGSGSIDSYDSNLGDYDSVTNHGGNVTVKTISASGEASLVGGTVIDGDLVVASKITLKGSADITGNVYSNGELTLKGNSTIGGDVRAYMSYTQSSGSVGGSIYANGNISLNQTPVGGNVHSRSNISIVGREVGGNVLTLKSLSLTRVNVGGSASAHRGYSQTEGNVGGGVRANGGVKLTGASINNNDLRYNGSGSFSRQSPNYNGAPYKLSSSINLKGVDKIEYMAVDDGKGDPDKPNCDPLGIEQEVIAVDDKAGSAKDLTVRSIKTYQIDELSAAFVGSSAIHVSARNAPFLGETLSVLMYDNVYLKGVMKVAPNTHVTMYVKGNFSMSGASKLIIPKGSSLTLIIKGVFDIKGGADIETPDQGLTAEGNPVFAIYSSSSGTGIYIRGGIDSIYAAIYAPLTDVDISSHVDFKGSVLGKSVSLKGSGDIHYDEALGNAKGGSGGAPATSRLVFKDFVFL